MGQLHHLWQTIGSVALLGLNPSSCLAQIIPDNTLPRNSVSIPSANTLRIEGGTQVGRNLFHSFSQFSVPTGTTAFFNNSLETENIVSRVTGSQISQIDGLIQANGNANLFLLNPQGIVFGPNARLDVGGSFVASTADSIQFSDRAEFRATPSATSPLLTLNVPIGLQFNAPTQTHLEQICVQGSGHQWQFAQTGALELIPVADRLAVQPGRTLALAGREITLEGGNLTAPSGTLALHAIVEGNLPLTVQAEQIRLQNPPADTQLGDIRLSGAASMNSSGWQGGEIQIHSRSLRVEQGSAIASVTAGTEPGRPVTVRASETIEFLGRTAEGRIGSGILVQTHGTGTGGDLFLATGRLTLRDGAAIGMGTDSAGRSGHVLIVAPQVELGGLSASGARLTGIFSNPTTASTGIGGDVTIAAQTLSLENGAVISVSTFGAGQSGNITVRARQVQVQGTSATGNVRSGFYARTTLPREGSIAPPLTGNAGNVTVIAEELTLQNRATINVANLGQGNAGNINIYATTLKLDTQAAIAATQRQAEQGNITIEAQDVRLRNRSTITTDASNTIVRDTGEAIENSDRSTDGGNISIQTQSLLALENSNITANAQQGFGGRVRINTNNLLRDPTSEISATSNLGPEFSGIVQINTPDVTTPSGLINLPDNLTDVSNQIVRGCGEFGGSRFAVVGRGGLPEDPNQTLLGSTIWRDLRFPQLAPAWTVQPSPSETPPLVEATGWVKQPNGRLELIAHSDNRVPFIGTQAYPCLGF
ncbi:filamentous hemagglutinin N-terminal domain-containing protein [Oscillatoria laete-virens NRMC-F 0139]|nr:filamentous hemagglutinin N-terminal domain-containing protein [Oscillatoria laete-virens]MDL5052463.1 filamentous hemagglutinin N-terminal domain-containing protein [Oscillatoria laete-virens NRMC-F 0139]